MRRPLPPTPATLTGLFAAALALTGCANTAAMRGLAAQTSGALTRDSGALGTFVATASQSALDRAATLADLQAARTDAQVAVERKRESWTLAGRKQDLELLAEVERVRPADILAGLPAPVPAMPALDDGGAGASLDKAAGTYKAMAAPPKAKDQLKAIFEAGQSVQQAVQTIKDKAASPP